MYCPECHEAHCSVQPCGLPVPELGRWKQTQPARHSTTAEGVRNPPSALWSSTVQKSKATFTVHVQPRGVVCGSLWCDALAHPGAVWRASRPPLEPAPLSPCALAVHAV